MIIGIPKSFIYWKRPCFWEVFFRELGCEVELSLNTNREIAKKGINASDPETCFSQKLYWGHILYLDGKCDYIFVPRLKTNGKKLEYCPKFFALPDLAKILVRTPILTETFDEKKEKFEKTIFKLGKKLARSKKDSRKAMEKAISKEKEIKDKEKEIFFQKINSRNPKIVLVSHQYNLYDNYANLNTEEKLKKLGVEPIFIDEVLLNRSRTTQIVTPINAEIFRVNPRNHQRLSASTIKFHWEFGEEIICQIEEILKHKISGAVILSSFQCGCDAVLNEFVIEMFKKKKVPVLNLIIDEHAGEAGLQTRLEAFIDTLQY